MFAKTAPSGAESTEAVGLIDHEEAVVAFFQLHEASEVGQVSVHAVDPFDDDEDSSVVGTLCGEDGLEGRSVVVRKGPAAGSGESSPLDETVVGKAVVEDEVAGAKEMSEGGLVGGMSADEGQGGFLVEEVGESGLEGEVDGSGSPDEATGTDTGAFVADGTDGGFGDFRMPGKAKVIVSAEMDSLATFNAGGAAPGALVNSEIRIRESGVAEGLAGAEESADFGKSRETVILGGGDGFFGFLNSFPGVGDGSREIIEGLPGSEGTFGKGNAEGSFDTVGEIQAPYTVESQISRETGGRMEKGSGGSGVEAYDLSDLRVQGGRGVNGGEDERARGGRFIARRLHPRGDRIEGGFFDETSAGVTLQFSAGGARKAPGFDETEHGRGEVMVFQKGAAEHLKGGRMALWWAPSRFGEQGKLLASVAFNGKGGNTVAEHCVTGDGLASGLKVVWIVVHATEDEEVFAASGEIDLPVADKSQVACSQPGAGFVGEGRSEGGPGGFFSIPVTLPDSIRLHPEFADGVDRENGSGIGIHHAQSDPIEMTTASDERF